MSANIKQSAWEDMNEPKKETAPAGYVGVRDAFKKAGLNDSQLGWNNGQVTYKGVTYKPDIVGDGVTYGSQKGVNDFIKRAVEADGGKVVQVNKYRDPSGLYDVGWNDATKEVLIGGERVPYLYYDDAGNTFARKSDLESAYKNLGKKVGVENPLDTFNRYQESMDKIYDKIDDVSAKKFKFDTKDLENDATWRAYEEMYKREGERAYEDTMAKVAARTGGSMSSMAQAAADQAYAYYTGQLTDKVPEIASEAYEKWLQDKNGDLNALLTRANGIENTYANEQAVRNENLTRFLAQQEMEKQRQYDKLDLDNAKLSSEAAALENMYNIADMLDVPIPAEIAVKYGVMPLADGTYPTPNQIMSGKNLEAWGIYQKPVFDYEMAQDLATYAAKMGIK